MCYDPESPPAPPPPGLYIERFGQPSDVPLSLIREMIAVHGVRYTRSNLNAMTFHNAVLWIGRIDGRLAGSRLSRRGENVPRWFVSLQDDDLLIYRGNTGMAFRGVGLSPAMIQYICRNELGEGAKAYSDTKVYNKASIRSLQKAGFRVIDTQPPLPKESMPPDTKETDDLIQRAMET